MNLKNEHFLEASWLKEVDPKINSMYDNDLNEKLNLLFSNGYFYNPYSKEFHNHFNRKTLSALIVSKLTLVRINEIINNFKISEPFYSLDSVEAQIFKESPFWRTEIFFDSGSGVFGILFYIISLILFITSNLVLSIICVFTSFFFIKWYVTDNSIYEHYYLTDATLSRLWQRSKNVFRLLLIVQYPTIIYMLFSYSGKWIIPILTISIIGYLIKKIVVKRKANNYWGNIFHSKITEYAVSINKTKNDGVGISEYKKYDDLLKKINNR